MSRKHYGGLTMNDLISRQAAIREYQKVCKGIKCDECPFLIKVNTEKRSHLITDCKLEAFLHDLPSAQRWIPVTERLPKFDELVLVWVENKDPKGRFNRPGIHTAQLRDRKPEHDPEGKKNIWGIPGYDSEWTVWAWSYFSEPDVTAWMPLPEPYKEEK